MNSFQVQALTVLALITPAAATTTDPSVHQGMASSLAVGLLTQGGPGAPILVKAPNNQGSAPPVFMASNFPTTPNYEMPELFRNGPHAPGQRELKWNFVDLDAMSTGNDWIANMGTNGQLQLGGRWLAAVASVTNATKGQDAAGNLIRRRRAMTTRRSTPGADLISYYYDVNAGPAANLRDTTVMEQECEALGYDENSTDDIEGLDFALGVISHGQGGSSLLFTNLNSFYFSITNDSADLLNINYPLQFAKDEQGTWVPVNGATVYRVLWSNGAWGDPVEYRTRAELKLTANDDIDALAVRPDGPIIFSLAYQQNRMTLSQLFIYDRAVSSDIFDLEDGNQQRVDVRLGVKDPMIVNNDDTEDIDAMSILDPEAHVYDTHMGIAEDWPVTMPWDATMGIAMTRYYEGVDEKLSIQVTGYGVSDPGSGTLTFLYGTWNNMLFQWEWAPTFTVPRPAGAEVFELPAFDVPNLPYPYTQGAMGALFVPTPSDGVGITAEPALSFLTIWEW